MPSEDLGPRPEPQIEPGEPNPGGVDAIDGDLDEHTTPDLPVEKNPAMDGGDDADDAGSAAVKEDVSSGEDTSTQATESTGDADDEPMSGEQESPA